MSRSIVFLLSLILAIIVGQITAVIVSTTETSENDDNGKTEKTIEVDVDKIKINGKTYFFQLRKGEQGNETTYKKIRNHKNEQFEEQFGVDIVVEDENPKEKVSSFESLKSRRRDFMVSCYVFYNQ